MKIFSLVAALLLKILSFKAWALFFTHRRNARENVFTHSTNAGENIFTSTADTRENHTKKFAKKTLFKCR